MNKITQCAVCGGKVFTDYSVLWQELIDTWQLSSDEVDYVNRQQGHCCASCKNNLRSIALGHAITQSLGYPNTLVEMVESEVGKNIRLLEINETGNLSSILSKLPQHKLASFPSYDMTNLSLPSNSFDLVIHSDTLEHISNPVTALTECYRVLVEHGSCIFTVPIILDRLSKSRKGLPESFHGNSGQFDTDYIVHTEFGADVWKYCIEAGFRNVKIHCLEYPAALAVEAFK